MRKRAKKFPFHPLWAVFLIIFCVGSSLYAFLQYDLPSETSIYIFPENPKQGDTVFIRVESRSDKISGVFEGEKIDFLRFGEFFESIAFLGIDLKMKPAEYKISLNVAGKEIEKTIAVEERDFSVSKMLITEELKNEGFTEKKIAENLEEKDNLALNEVLANFTSEPYFESPFSFPLSKTEKGGLDFGELLKAKNYQLQHFGVDLRAPWGTKVYAVNDGKVVFADELFNYGKTLVIDHGLDIFSLYLHLSDVKVSSGERLKRGQLISLSGNSGYSAAPHLHFSMRDGKSRIDPILFIEATKKTRHTLLASVIANIRAALLRFFNIIR